jgi:3-oxoacyl-[acyl-carrier protein] reductase
MTVVVVTGGLGALGSVIGERYVAQGAEVHLVDLAPDTAQRAEALGAVGHVVDVTDEQQVGAFGAALGGVDQLVNAAGIWPPADFADLDLASWRRVVDVSLTGAYLVTRALLAGLVERRGCVVNVSSAIALKGQARMVAYAAGKAGVIGMTKALARELGPAGVRINALAPGLVDTPHNRTLWPQEVWDRMDAERCLPGAVEPGDVADAALLLGSPLARKITGQTIVIDGGVVLH